MFQCYEGTEKPQEMIDGWNTYYCKDIKFWVSVHIFYIMARLTPQHWKVHLGTVSVQTHKLQELVTSDITTED